MNILTFDIEEWWAYEHFSIGKKKDYIPRLNNFLYTILDKLDEIEVKGTFFCLGEVAKAHPKIIKKISSRGHHIGSHSYSHKFFRNVSYSEVAEDTKKSIDILENIIGAKVTAYRAPAFSITEQNKWIFEILLLNGITHDSSIFPANRSFGGFPSFPKNSPSIINYHGYQIKEFPMSTTNLLGKEIGYSGGGYFRIIPYPLIKKIIKKTDYVITYFHLKDFDLEQSRIYRSFEGEAAIRRYFKKYYGLKGNFRKFATLIENNRFISIQEADQLVDWSLVPIIHL